MNHFESSRKRMSLPTKLTALALLATLVFSGTREVHILTARLMLRLQYGNMIVRGQPPGCTIYVIPHVIPSESFRNRIHTESPSSPDAYILATVFDRDLHTVPSPELWENQPLIEWAALELSGRVTDRSTQVVTPQDNQYLDDALNFVRFAQVVRPDNGALWLAEASILMRMDQTDDAMTALRQAARRPQWNEQPEVYLYGKKLLEEKGFPSLDANIRAFSFSWPSIGARLFVDRVVRWKFEENLKFAIECGDIDQFRKIMQLVHLLQRGRWRHGNHTNQFRVHLPLNDLVYGEFLGTMAARLGRSIPSNETLPPGERRKVGEKLYQDYLSTYLNPVLVKQLNTENEAVLQERKLRRTTIFENYQRDILYAMLSRGFGGLCLVLLAFLCGMILTEISFRYLVGTGILGEWRARGLGFWAALATACIVMTMLIYGVFESVNQPVGLRSGPSPKVIPFLSDAQAHLLISLTACVLWITVRFLGRRWPNWFRGGLFALCWLYLGSVSATAYFRDEATKAITARECSIKVPIIDESLK